LNRRLEDIGWGLLLIMTGGVLLVPGELLPRGTWLIGAGVILLVLNLVRYLNGIRMKGFTTILGLIALAAGLGEFYGVQLPLLAIFLILVGASIILKPLMGENR
jgi:hypothetical protein